MSLKRALVAVDLRGATTEVVKAAIDLVAPHGAEIVLFNVVSAAPGVNPLPLPAAKSEEEQLLATAVGATNICITSARATATDRECEVLIIPQK
jgi:hypothetical protein